MKLLACFLFCAAAAMAQQLSGDALVKALKEGGYVIVMRHASSPRELPDKAIANPDNTKPERQLDSRGRASSTAFGQALRRLEIPIGEVLSSPTYRALETAKFAELSHAVPTPELGDNGQSMSGVSTTQIAWLQERVKQTPKETNTLLITHQPNIVGAFPHFGQAIEDGEALIFGPDATLAAQIKIGEWPGLVK